MRCHFISLGHVEIDLQDYYQSFLKVILDTWCDKAHQVKFLFLFHTFNEERGKELLNLSVSDYADIDGKTKTRDKPFNK